MRTLTSLFTLSFVLPVLAQESTPAPTTTAAAGPVLVVKTADVEAAESFAMMAFGHMEPLPAPPDGGHYVLSLDADKKLAVTTAGGAVGLFELTCDPGALMDVYAAEIEDTIPLVRGAMTMAMQQSGMTTKQAFALVQDMLAFPRQLAKVALRVDGDPEAMEEGLDVVLDLDGKPGSAFATAVEKLEPNAAGVPKVGNGDSVMDLRFGVAPEGLQAMFAPMRDWAVGLMAQDEEGKARAAAMYDKWMGLYDGSIAMSLEEGMRMRMLIGVRDGDELRAELGSEEYLAMVQNQRTLGRDVEVEVTPNAAEHRGVQLLRSRVTGMEDNPMAPDGTLDTWLGAAGNWFVMAIGGGKDAATGLIDAVADDKIVRAALPGSALMDVRLDFGAFLAMAGPQAGMPPGAMPESMTMQLTRTGTALRLTTRVQ